MHTNSITNRKTLKFLMSYVYNFNTFKEITKKQTYMISENFTFIKTDKKLVKLYFNEITVIKGLGNYVVIQTTENKKYIYYKSLKDLIENLPNEFMRVHNSHIVNLTNIDVLEDNHIIIKNVKVAVGKSYKECLNSAINKYML